MVQMHQKEQVGGGEATNEKYETWEIKECPICGRLVREYYLAEVITPTKFARLKAEMDVVYEPEMEEIPA